MTNKIKLHGQLLVDLNIVVSGHCHEHARQMILCKQLGLLNTMHKEISQQQSELFGDTLAAQVFMPVQSARCFCIMTKVAIQRIFYIKLCESLLCLQVPHTQAQAYCDNLGMTAAVSKTTRSPLLLACCQS